MRREDEADGVTVPPEMIGDATAALVLRPEDTLVVVMKDDTTAEALDETVERFRSERPALKDRVLFVVGIEQLAVLRGEVPA